MYHVNDMKYYLHIIFHQRDDILHIGIMPRKRSIFIYIYTMKGMNEYASCWYTNIIVIVVTKDIMTMSI